MANKCNSCGATIPDAATVCPYCGNSVTPITASYSSNEQDEPSTGLNILSLFVPIAGWIMYFVFKDETPVKAKACAKWAWIGFGISVAFSLLSVMIEACSY